MVDSSFNLKVGNYSADDIWVSKWLQITPTALGATGKYTLDLVAQGYLPNDSYDYEVIVNPWCWSTGTVGQSVSIWLFNGPDTGASRFRISLCFTVPRVSGQGTAQATSATLPIIGGNNKYITFYNSTGYTMSSWGFQLTGYRRLGVNE